MSSQAARASRREIRKAFGPQALHTLVDHEDALKNHRLNLDVHETRLVAVEKRSDADRAQLARIDGIAGATFGSLAEFCGRSFWGRVRWFLTGK